MEESPKSSAIFIDKVVVRSVVVLFNIAIRYLPGSFGTTGLSFEKHSEDSQLSEDAIEGCTSTTRHGKEDPLRSHTPRVHTSDAPAEAKTLCSAGLRHLLLGNAWVDWLRDLMWFLSQTNHFWMSEGEIG